MSSVPCRTALRCFDSFGMEETLPSITPMVVIRLSNRQDVARNDEIRAMHSLKTSLTISPVKRAWSHVFICASDPGFVALCLSGRSGAQCKLAIWRHFKDLPLSADSTQGCPAPKLLSSKERIWP